MNKISLRGEEIERPPAARGNSPLEKPNTTGEKLGNCFKRVYSVLDRQFGTTDLISKRDEYHPT
jgi:hypothetical protein